MCRRTNQYAAVITALTERAAEDRLLPGSLAGGGHGLLHAVAPCPCEGKRQRSRQNSRYLTRLSRYLSTTGPIMASRQERQIVQSQLHLDDFLP